MEGDVIQADRLKGTPAPHHRKRRLKVCLLTLSHSDKKPRPKSTQKPHHVSADQPPASGQVCPVSSDMGALDKEHGGGHRPLQKEAELTVLEPVLFLLERRVAWGPGQGLAAWREGGWEGKASLTR